MVPFNAALRALVAPEQTLSGREASSYYWIRLEAFLADRDWRTVVKNHARANTRGWVADTDEAWTIAKVIRDGVWPAHFWLWGTSNYVK